MYSLRPLHDLVSLAGAGIAYTHVYTHVLWHTCFHVLLLRWQMQTPELSSVLSDRPPKPAPPEGVHATPAQFFYNVSSPGETGAMHSCPCACLYACLGTRLPRMQAHFGRMRRVRRHNGCCQCCSKPIAMMRSCQAKSRSHYPDILVTTVAF